MSDQADMEKVRKPLQVVMAGFFSGLLGWGIAWPATPDFESAGYYVGIAIMYLGVAVFVVGFCWLGVLFLERFR